MPPILLAEEFSKAPVERWRSAPRGKMGQNPQSVAFKMEYLGMVFLVFSSPKRYLT